MADEFVMDASMAMAWCFEDESSPYSDWVLDILETGAAVVPAIWPLEICNVLLAAERKKRIEEADSIRFLALLVDLPIGVEQEPAARMMKEIFALARQQSLSSYDASYLDLSMRRGLPIATLDQKLMKAAQQVGVPVLKNI
jgi:predicted nucleic acid-binding protein